MEKNATASETVNKGSLVVISGFSGVGKGTVVKTLLSEYPDYQLSISATTRAPRENEQDGREYHFITEEAFRRMIDTNGLIEYTVYCNHYYGTPRSFLEENLRDGKDVILEIEVNGALNIRRLYPDAILIFMTAPSAHDLVDRLSGRGTESEEVILARLQRALTEAESIDRYDYVIVNDTPQTCADRIHALKNAVAHPSDSTAGLISEARSDLPANQDFIRQFNEELRNHLEYGI